MRLVESNGVALMTALAAMHRRSSEVGAQAVVWLGG